MVAIGLSAQQLLAVSCLKLFDHGSKVYFWVCIHIKML